jgi:chromosome segregation ATPase
MERTGSEFQITNRNQRNPACYIALASDAEDHFSSTGSVLVDCSNLLMNQYRNTIARLRSELTEINKERTEALEWKNAQVADLEAGVQSSQQALEWRQSQISNLQESEQWLQDQAQLLGEQLDQERKDAAAYIESLEGTIREKDKHIARVEDSFSKANTAVQQLASFRASRAWVVFTKLREIRQFLFGSK